MRAAAAEVKAVGPAVEKAGQASAQQLEHGLLQFELVRPYFEFNYWVLPDH
jgi:hypothetical protein